MREFKRIIAYMVYILASGVEDMDGNGKIMRGFAECLSPGRGERGGAKF